MYKIIYREHVRRWQVIFYTGPNSYNLISSHASADAAIAARADIVNRYK